MSITYPTFHEALSPKGDTIHFITDSSGHPKLRFDTELGYFIPVIPLDADLGLLTRTNTGWEVKEAVARHPRATGDILLTLSKHRNRSVSEAARMHPAFPSAALMAA